MARILYTKKCRILMLDSRRGCVPDAPRFGSDNQTPFPNLTVSSEAFKPVMSKITIEGVCKIYASKTGRVMALENVDLTIKQNEFITLVGPSGCGKSTLLKLIGALIRPSRGVLLFDGQQLLKSDTGRRNCVPGGSASGMAQRSRQRPAPG